MLTIGLKFKLQYTTSQATRIPRGFSSPSVGAGRRCAQSFSDIDAQPQSQHVREEERWDEDLQELCRENAPFLHGSTLPHA